MSEKASEHNLLYILAYSLEWLSGLIVYFLFSRDNERLKAHSIQAIAFGIISIIIAIIVGIFSKSFATLINAVIWLYCVYVGYRAYGGKDIILFSLEKSQQTNELVPKHKKHISAEATEHDHIKTLKLRYARGEITKKQYEKIKKDLEKS